MQRAVDAHDAGAARDPAARGRRSGPSEIGRQRAGQRAQRVQHQAPDVDAPVAVDRRPMRRAAEADRSPRAGRRSPPRSSAGVTCMSRAIVGSAMLAIEVSSTDIASARLVVTTAMRLTRAGCAGAAGARPVPWPGMSPGMWPGTRVVSLVIARSARPIRSGCRVPRPGVSPPTPPAGPIMCSPASPRTRACPGSTSRRCLAAAMGRQRGGCVNRLIASTAYSRRRASVVRPLVSRRRIGQDFSLGASRVGTTCSLRSGNARA